MKTYALVGHFNHAMENTILEIWKELNDKGISNYGFTYEGRKPHLTLADFETDSVEEIKDIIRGLKVNHINIRLQSISNFLGTQTIMYNIFPSSKLLDFHKYITKELDAYIPSDSLYRKDNWVPHTTIASRLSDDNMLKAYSMAKLSETVIGSIDKLVLLEIKSNSESTTVLEMEINDLKSNDNLVEIYDGDCIFCKIANYQLESRIIYEDELVIAFLDIDPINEGHVLIVPKKHRLDLDELCEEESDRVMKVSKTILRTLRKVYSFDGYSIMQNGGIYNDIGHYHMHVFPRNENDGFSWNFKETVVKTTDLDFQKLKNEISKIES